jgi:16S rRNA G527 N7-methylase RsmG
MIERDDLNMATVLDHQRKRVRDLHTVMSHDSWDNMHQMCRRLEHSAVEHVDLVEEEDD